MIYLPRKLREWREPEEFFTWQGEFMQEILGHVITEAEYAEKKDVLDNWAKIMHSKGIEPWRCARAFRSLWRIGMFETKEI